MKNYLNVNPEVKEALEKGKAVVALESTRISHGMPYPKNVETALNVEQVVRDQGAIPATIAIMDGKCRIGLSANELEYSGSFVRGITVGNRQDAALNSGFNLNINGKLANGLEINATMTDANIPIQQEGNSASIQEFDSILIQLKKDSHKIILGDFDVSEEPYYRMMKFDRKLQGIRYQTAVPIGNNSVLRFGAGAAGEVDGVVRR